MYERVNFKTNVRLSKFKVFLNGQIAVGNIYTKNH